MRLKLQTVFAAWTILATVGQTQMWAPSSRELRHPAKAGLPSFSIWIGHHHFNRQICNVSFSCWSGMLATMSGWKAMLAFCQKPFLSNWRRYKSQVMNMTPLDLTYQNVKLVSGLMYCGRGDGSDFSVEVDQVTLEPKPDTMSLNNMLRYKHRKQT